MAVCCQAASGTQISTSRHLVALAREADIQNYIYVDKAVKMAVQETS